ncbi:hypothetical protein C8R44DRAFT_974430 [Mycena epipterygia]|nr:hypothetical protein C8R44DRAFT_974430 [Mycena epipterygia]
MSDGQFLPRARRSPALQFSWIVQQEALLKLRQQFIDVENFGINDIQDGIEKILPDQESASRKIWIAHVGDLNVAWERIVKGQESILWPEVHLFPRTPAAPANAFDQLKGAEQCAAVRAQRKLETSGFLPSEGNVEPIHSAKSIFAACIEQKQKQSTTGRKRDFLADECVIQGTQSVTRKNGP